MFHGVCDTWPISNTYLTPLQVQLMLSQAPIAYKYCRTFNCYCRHVIVSFLEVAKTGVTKGYAVTIANFACGVIPNFHRIYALIQ